MYNVNNVIIVYSYYHRIQMFSYFCWRESVRILISKIKEMMKIVEEKKFMRGIDENFSEEFRKCSLFELYKKNIDELFIGVRNNYLNLYYNCDSIAKIEYKERKKKITYEINGYYLGDEFRGDTRRSDDLNYICDQYYTIKERSNDRAASEKKAQAKLVLLNNGNETSNWFCLDIEYVKQFNNKQEKENADFNGRFDIVALSKKKPHRVALIELKYGRGAIGGKSGIYKHIEDFRKFNDNCFFENHFRKEIIEIIRSQRSLGISVPFQIPEEKEILTPEFYVITLDNNKEKGSTPKQTMAGYLFKDKRWSCNRLSNDHCYENNYRVDVTKKNSNPHVTFLFSKVTLEAGIEKITDIIDGDYDEKIFPE